MDRITLDKDVFKALASDTRLDILKALDERQKTVTELARELKLNKATVFEHLERLISVEMVQKLEDHRKWVYYQLTWKGRRLLHPEKITIALLLSSAFASLVTGGVAFWLYQGSNGAPSTHPEGDVGIMERGIAAAPPVDAGPDGTLLWIGAALLLLTLTLSVVAGYIWRQAKARDGPAAA